MNNPPGPPNNRIEFSAVRHNPRNMHRSPAPRPFFAPALLAGAALLLAALPALAQETAQGAPEQTLFDVVAKGGWAMIPLALLSVFTVAFAAYCFLAIRERTITSGRFRDSIDAYLKKRDLLGLLAQSSHEHEALARVVQSTLQFATTNPGARYELLREIAETEGSRQAARLYQQVSYLFDVGVIAPMVGLAGTVTGMIQSFHILGVNPETIRPQLLANGVAEALIATAGGLVVGIPAMVAYSYFKGRVQWFVAEMEAAATDFIARLEAAHPRA